MERPWGRNLRSPAREPTAGEEQASQDYFPDHGLLIQVMVDPEIFETNSGSLYVWFDDQGVPGRGIIEDLIGLGDVRGYLDKEGV